MDTVTIPKTEYQRLVERAFRYEYLANIVRKKENIFAPPPTKNIKEVIESFQATGMYSPAFLKSLERGLNRSSYFRVKQQNENSTTSSRAWGVLEEKGAGE